MSDAESATGRLRARVRPLSEMDVVAELKLQRMTADEFLDWQQSQDHKYELIDGFPVLPLKAMTGATHAHDLVVVNVLRELATQLRRKSCKATTDAIALKISAMHVRRSDVTVECGKPDLKGTSAVEPRLVVEVLSPSTMNFDRFRKVELYKSVPSIAYVLLIDTEKPQLTLHRRDGERWTLHDFTTLDAVVDLPAIEASLAARDVFEGLPFAD